jgi:ABC-type transport system involved in multi-copper enzyme maturation permease subunit
MRTLVLAQNEFIKTRRRLAFLVALGGFATLMLIGFGGIHHQAAGRHAFELPGAWTEILGGPGVMSAFFTAMVIVLLVASEFTWRTARQNVIDGLSKEEFFAAKLLLLPVVGIIFFGVLLVIGGGFALNATPSTAGVLIRVSDATYMAGALIGLLGWGAMAFLLATTIRSSGPAIAAFFLYFLAEQVIGQLIARIGPTAATITRYLPTALFKALWQPGSYSNGPLPQGAPPHIAVSSLMLAGAGYVVGFLVTAFLVYRRRDL